MLTTFSAVGGVRSVSRCKRECNNSLNIIGYSGISLPETPHQTRAGTPECFRLANGLTRARGTTQNIDREWSCVLRRLVIINARASFQSALNLSRPHDF